MESIFHEKQEGSLCAQHCLNNLLQGEYFSPVELSSIAEQLDEEERMRMAEGGVQTEEYRTFLQQPSGNMDDSGFFSIQVRHSKAVQKLWVFCFRMGGLSKQSKSSQFLKER
uniref:ubiquitinyl hydrolase 1 n=1 Tax=Cyprinus carpio TaxID=7962 RepID=A0A8C2F5V5_CYPCA